MSSDQSSTAHGGGGPDDLAEVVLRFDSVRQVEEDLGPFLSSDGFFHPTTAILPTSSVVRFRLLLPDDFVLIEGAGVVLWSREDLGGAEPPGMAIRFVTLAKRSKEIVDQLVEAHLARGGQPFDIDNVTLGAPKPRPTTPAPAPEARKPAGAPLKLSLKVRGGEQPAPPSEATAGGASVTAPDEGSLSVATRPPAIQPSLFDTPGRGPLAPPAGGEAGGLQTEARVLPERGEVAQGMAPAQELLPSIELGLADDGSPGWADEGRAADATESGPYPGSFDASAADDEGWARVEAPAPDLESAADPVEVAEPAPSLASEGSLPPVAFAGEDVEEDWAPTGGESLPAAEASEELDAVTSGRDEVVAPATPTPLAAAAGGPAPEAGPRRPLYEDGGEQVARVAGGFGPATRRSGPAPPPPSTRSRWFDDPEGAADVVRVKPPVVDIAYLEPADAESEAEAAATSQRPFAPLGTDSVWSGDGIDDDAGDLTDDLDGLDDPLQTMPRRAVWERLVPLAGLLVVAALAVITWQSPALRERVLGLVGMDRNDAGEQSMPGASLPAVDETTTAQTAVVEVAETRESDSGTGAATGDATAAAVDAGTQGPANGDAGATAGLVGGEPDDTAGPLPEPTGPATGLVSVTWHRSPGTTEVILHADGTVDETSVRVGALGEPPRVLVRIARLQGFPGDEVAIGSPEVERIRFGYHPEVRPPALYAVLDLSTGGARLDDWKVSGATVRVRVSGP